MTKAIFVIFKKLKLTVALRCGQNPAVFKDLGFWIRCEVAGAEGRVHFAMLCVCV